jgi:Cd(II)/Pb(II)-responsive transcriptional regulator
MMKIGELSTVTGCSVQTIRHYEKEKLIAASERSEGNFRLYDEAAVEQLRFIKHCRSLDLCLPEIRQLLALNRSPAAQCDDVNRMMDDHIKQVEVRIRELTKLSEQLRALRRSCSNQQTVEHCGILRNLSATPSSMG